MESRTLEAIVPILGVMMPLSAIVLGIGVAFWAIYWKHRTQRLQYEERRLMIEKGITPPPVLPDRERRRRWTHEDCLKYGTIMVFLGIGFGIAFVLEIVFGEATCGGRRGSSARRARSLGCSVLGTLSTTSSRWTRSRRRLVKACQI